MKKEVSIFELGLSKRTVYLLVENGIKNATDLLATDNSELIKIRGIGKKTIEEISIVKQEIESKGKNLQEKKQERKRVTKEKDTKIDTQKTDLEKMSIEELELLAIKKKNEINSIISEIQEQQEKIKSLDEKIAKLRGEKEDNER